MLFFWMNVENIISDLLTSYTYSIINKALGVSITPPSAFGWLAHSDGQRIRIDIQIRKPAGYPAG